MVTYIAAYYRHTVEWSDLNEIRSKSFVEDTPQDA